MEPNCSPRLVRESLTNKVTAINTFIAADERSCELVMKLATPANKKKNAYNEYIVLLRLRTLRQRAHQIKIMVKVIYEHKTVAENAGLFETVSKMGIVVTSNNKPEINATKESTNFSLIISLAFSKLKVFAHTKN